jgi:UDP-glucose 4-epimerase
VIYKMRKVLVIGGAGFIGRNLVHHLLNQREYTVIAADINVGSNWVSFESAPDLASRFRGVKADFTDPASFELLDKDIQDVYMLAAVVGVNRTLKHPEDVIRTNTLLTLNTLNWLKSADVERLLFASSSENYAGTSDLFDINIPTNEQVPLCISDISHPRWTYAVSKIHGEAAFLHSAKSLGYDCTIVRYQNIIGPEMGFGHAIPHIVERFVAGEGNPFNIYGSEQTRSFCAVQDAVMGTVGALEASKSGEIYHIGNKFEITIEELTRYIGELMGYTGSYVSSETYPGSVSRRCPDINKAQLDFGYRPELHWREAVELTVDWYRDYFSSGQKPSEGGFESPEVIRGKMQL